MTFALSLLALFTLSYAGLCALSLAMDRHYADIYGRGAQPSPRLRRKLQLTGAVSLALALVAALRAEGGSHGFLLWLGSVSAATAAVMLLLSYHPRLAQRLGYACTAIGAISSLLIAL